MNYEKCDSVGGKSVLGNLRLLLKDLLLQVMRVDFGGMQAINSNRPTEPGGACGRG